MENFAQLLEEYSTQNVTVGEMITAEVVAIDNNFITVNAGLKSEGIIDVKEFKDKDGKLEVKIGDAVSVIIESLENGFGETKLSRYKAKLANDWMILEEAMKDGTILKGEIVDKVKGGLKVIIGSIVAFLPGSLVDIRPVKDMSPYVGKEVEFKIIKLDKKRNNIVISRRAVLEETLGEEREALISSLKEGAVVNGIVKNITDYGAFVDLGGVDGLLHITDLAWRRIKHPSEILEIGQEVTASVINYDKEKNRVSLGLKQLDKDPWNGLAEKYPKNTKIVGKVSNLTDYGAFVAIEQGIEGLVHVSEMDWTNKNVHPSKVVKLGDEVEVIILDINEEKRRISLGMKQCQPNPWKIFSEAHNKGEKIKGIIKSITDFGIFIGLPGGIDGLVHYSDLSWSESSEESIRKYKKNDEIETIILAIDTEKERISLGIKQLEEDSFTNYINNNDKGSEVKGKVISIDDNIATVELYDQVEAVLRINDNIEDNVNAQLKVGDEIEAVITNIDKKNRSISIDMKSKSASKKSQTKSLRAVVDSNNINSGTTSLGDLLKAKLTNNEEENEK